MKYGPLAAARVLHGFQRGFVHRQRVHAVDLHRFDVGHARFLVHVRHRRGFVDRHAHAVLVVLAHEHHRQFPQRGQIQAFVELAVVGAAVAEEHHRHAIFLGALRGQRQPHRDGHMPRHDGIAAPEILASHRQSASSRRVPWRRRSLCRTTRPSSAWDRVRARWRGRDRDSASRCDPAGAAREWRPRRWLPRRCTDAGSRRSCPADTPRALLLQSGESAPSGDTTASTSPDRARRQRRRSAPRRWARTFPLSWLLLLTWVSLH